MRRVTVEDQLDGGVGRRGLVERFEQANELARAMTLVDAGTHAPGKQVDPSQQAQRAWRLYS